MPRKAQEMEALTDEQRDLVAANLRLAYKFVSTCVPSGVIAQYPSREDAVQVCVLAMMRCAQKYDGTGEFSTYAYAAMKNAIINGRTSIVSVPRRVPSPTFVELNGEEAPASLPADILERLEDAADDALAGMEREVAMAQIHGATPAEVCDTFSLSYKSLAEINTRVVKALRGFSESP